MAAKKIDRLLARLVKAEDAVLAELRKLYPEGSAVRVYLQANQRYPSSGVVWGYGGGRYGYVRVKLRFSPEQMVRDVSLDHIERE